MPLFLKRQPRARPRRWMVATWALGWLALGACGGARDTRIAAHPSADDDALTQRAGTVLVEALTDASQQQTALAALRMAGAAGLPWVKRALEGRHTLPVQAELQAMLAARGDTDAVAWLVAADGTDTTTVACRLGVLNAETHHAELMAALRHAGGRVREVALRRLRTTLTALEAQELAHLSRLDPEASVRATALEALTTRGLLDASGLRERLEDRELSVRALAMRELARLDCATARDVLSDRMLGTPSSDGLAAVSAIAPCGPEALDVTVPALQRALASTNAALRAEAATTADRLAWPRMPQWLMQALTTDPVPSVRLALALAILDTQPELAREALSALARGENRMVALQAAVVLAEAGDEAALSVVAEARTHQDVRVRHAAYRALGQLVRGGEWLAAGLDDPDTGVRLAAAAALLRATL